MNMEHWCRITIIVLLIQITSALMFSQSTNKRDYIWLFGGYGETELLKVDFNEKPGVFQLRQEGLDFNSNNVSISNENGELLFYSNGCAVADKNHNIMPNGHEINDGPFFELYWFDDCRYGYPGIQDIFIIPDPKINDGYYIIHKPVEYVPELDSSFFIRYLKYSYVDMTLNNGHGDVTTKNKIFLDGSLLASYLTGIQHENATDWWILQPKSNSNSYYKILLDSTGFSKIDSQSIGLIFDRNASASGDAKFSPDGTMYAYFNLIDGLFLYDFDRGSGVLSNFRHLKLRDSIGYELASVEFSPDSRFIYLAATDSLWQIDVWEENLNDGKILIDVWNGSYDPLPTHFSDALLAPDCKIYIRPPTGVRSMHVINHPNKKGKTCDFQQQTIPIPTYLDRGSFPNFPRFRVDDDMVCDSTLTSIFGEPIFIRKELLIYPNPASEFVTIQLPENRHGNLFMYDSMLREVFTTKEVNGESEVELDVSQYQAGTYYIEYIPDDRSSRTVYGSKLVVTD